MATCRITRAQPDGQNLASISSCSGRPCWCDQKLSPAFRDLIWEGVVDSGEALSSNYMISGEPGEHISKAAHKAVLMTMQQAAAKAYENARLQLGSQVSQREL